MISLVVPELFFLAILDVIPFNRWTELTNIFHRKQWTGRVKADRG